ncbi:DUF7620 family protein [Kitasatospora purpeofusca]|uniref:DUF7620 family protein n=1 Tax=Kitasatospora purpeofusca TaxID=67352 RepID=UPI004063D502
MPWIPAWLRRRSRVSLVRQSPRSSGRREAVEALRRAEQARTEGMARADEVAATAERLRQCRSENHFAERIRIAMMEGGN